VCHSGLVELIKVRVRFRNMVLLRVLYCFDVYDINNVGINNRVRICMVRLGSVGLGLFHIAQVLATSHGD